MLTVGQIVYCEPGFNISKRIKGIVEGTVVKIGRKYVEINIRFSTYKFSKNDLQQVTNYVPDYYVYLTKQEIMDKQERQKLLMECKSTFDPYNKGENLSLEKLRKIKEIINESPVACHVNCKHEQWIVDQSIHEISLEEVEKLYAFLQGEIADNLNLRVRPNLTADQSFEVIYYLQEVFKILPDRYEQCHVPGCGNLFDSEVSGCAGLYCDGCGCQYPEMDEHEDEDDNCGCDCDSCPAVLGTEETTDCGKCEEQGNKNCSCMSKPAPGADI